MAQTKRPNETWRTKSCAVIVAHPDDETLWAGGTILLQPEADWTVITLCRKNDPERAPRFLKALENFGAAGAMGDLDDDPEQTPLSTLDVQHKIMEMLPSERFDIIITHGPWGEYTRHLRHEETGNAVFALWKNEKLFADQLWRFAYEDGGGKYLPRFVRDADRITRLPEQIWEKKYEIITKIYGFAPDSFEAKTTPRNEAFWCFARRKTT